MIEAKSEMYCRPIDEPSGDAGWGCDCDVELEDISNVGDESGQDVRFAQPSASEHCSEKLRTRVQCLDAIVKRSFLCGFEGCEHSVRSGLEMGAKVAELSGFVVVVVFFVRVHFVIQCVEEHFVLRPEIGKVSSLLHAYTWHAATSSTISKLLLIDLLC